jgi:hypothetical protein
VTFRAKTAFTSFAALAALILAPAFARAQFAEPPDQPLIAREEPREPAQDRFVAEPDSGFYAPKSTLRLHVGPALRVSEDNPDGGLFAALDIGERAAGLRLSGSWVRVGSESGMQHYTGELWIDFGEGERLHPILGAGAGVARVTLTDAQTGDTSAHTLGTGVLRGSLEYGLPVRSTDARAGISVIGAVPAIRSSDDVSSSPWVLFVATVGVGF